MGQQMPGLQRLQGEGFSVGLSGECMWDYRWTGEVEVGELKREISEGKALLGEHREERELKQYAAQGALAFNEEDEVYWRCVH